jgi:hypothetical protein
MRVKRSAWVTVLIALAATNILSQQTVAPSGPYLGQKPPGLTPEIFAPGIVSKDGGFGNWDLYASFRAAAGGWGPLVNLGSAVNTEAAEAGASFSPDGKHLFFSRAGDIFWVSARILEVPAAGARPTRLRPRTREI